ncbi:MAG: flotillin family protein [Bacilli bacterium]|nr:flotillin family protein [Bacilli bacterium]MBQ3307584.1 flotillin family protein [Bacilli bacterium]
MILAIIIGIAVLAVILFIAMSYIKCPPDMVYLISGLRKEPRVLIGKAGIRIPFFERVDKLTLELIQIDVRTSRVPTADFINVDVDAVANVRIPKDNELIQIAARHFLNQDARYISTNVQQVLEGNMREIIGQLDLKALVNDKQAFSQKIQENASDDIRAIGLEIVNLNVQSCTDENNAINDLGIDNLAQIQKSAKIAKAQAEKEIKIAESKADEEGAKARAEADAKIAEQQKDLELKRAEFKIEQDRKKAEADAAYSIKQAEQQKTVNETSVAAEVAKAERMADLKEKEVILKEKELDALVRKQADAEKYAAEQKAQAEKIVRQQEAEADLIEAENSAKAKVAQAKADREAAELEAAGIKAKLEAEADGKKAILLAEAEGIKAKALAEAEGIEKKAEAQAKMKEASIVEMAMNALPQIAKEVSTPLGNIENITMYGDQTSEFIKSGTQNISKVVDIAKDSLGLDLKSMIAGFLGGKTLSDISNKKTKNNDKNEASE